MSYTSGFFDAIDQGGGDYDRVYSAETFAHYFSLLVKNGVFPDPSTGLQVRASSSPDMKVSVSPGSGWINGYYITVPDNSPEVLTVPTANPSLSRYDSVIMGLNFVDRKIELYIKSGAVSASPSPVTLQRDNDLYELELARISVGAGTASITQSLIIDTRSDSTRCGIVAGMIDQIDTTDLFAQYDDAFQTWFEDIQAQLSGNVAANLQNQINQLNSALTGKADALKVQKSLLNLCLEKALEFAVNSYNSNSTGRERNSGYIPGSTLTALGNAGPQGETAKIGVNPTESTQELSQAASSSNFLDIPNTYNDKNKTYRIGGIGFKASKAGMKINLNSIRLSFYYYDASYSASAAVVDAAIVRYDPNTKTITKILAYEDYKKQTVAGSNPSAASGGTTFEVGLSYTTTEDNEYIGLVAFVLSGEPSNNGNRLRVPLSNVNPSQLRLFSKLSATFNSTSSSYSIKNAFDLGILSTLTITDGLSSGQFPCMGFSISGGADSGQLVADVPALQDDCEVLVAVVEADSSCNPLIYAGDNLVPATSETEQGSSANGTSCVRTVLKVVSALEKGEATKIVIPSSEELTVYDVCTKSI